MQTISIVKGCLLNCMFAQSNYCHPLLAGPRIGFNVRAAIDVYEFSLGE